MEQEIKLPETIFEENIPICIDGKQIQIPLTITADGYFGIGTSQELIAISGRIVGDIAQLRHIYIAEELRGQRIGATLLTELERYLRERGVKRFFPLFFKTGTIDFFIRMGYQIVPQSTLTKKELFLLGLENVRFDEALTNINEFQTQRKMKPDSSKKVLLMKKL